MKRRSNYAPGSNKAYKPNPFSKSALDLLDTLNEIGQGYVKGVETRASDPLSAIASALQDELPQFDESGKMTSLGGLGFGGMGTIAGRNAATANLKDLAKAEENKKKNIIT